MVRKVIIISRSLAIHVRKAALRLAKIQPICPNHQLKKKKITFYEMGIMWYELWNIKVKLNRLGILPSNPKQKFISDKFLGKKINLWKIIKTESWYFEDQPSHSEAFGRMEGWVKIQITRGHNILLPSYSKVTVNSIIYNFFLIGRMPTMDQGTYTYMNIHTCVYV